MDDSLTPNLSGVFFLPATEAASATVAVDLQNFAKMRDLLRPLGEALDFPKWYGANLDALFDCLADPDWLEAGGIVRFYGLSTLVQNDPEGWVDLLEVLRSACEARTDDESSPLTILLDVAEEGIPHWTGQ